MNSRVRLWSIAGIAAAAIILGSCRKLPNPFEPIVGTNITVREEARANGKLLVTAASGSAASAGIQTGDLIVAVNGRPVGTARELSEAIRASGKFAALVVERGGAKIDIPIPNESARD